MKFRVLASELKCPAARRCSRLLVAGPFGLSLNGVTLWLHRGRICCHGLHKTGFRTAHRRASEGGGRLAFAPRIRSSSPWPAVARSLKSTAEVMVGGSASLRFTRVFRLGLLGTASPQARPRELKRLEKELQAGIRQMPGTGVAKTKPPSQNFVDS